MTVPRNPLSVPGLAGGDGSFAPVVSAYSGTPVAEVEQADATAIDHVLARQRALFADRDGWLPTPERIGVLHRAADLLVDTPAEARVMREEVFGPVVSVVGCADLDDAIARSNALPWAFQAAVVTRDVDRAPPAARRPPPRRHRGDGQRPPPSAWTGCLSAAGAPRGSASAASPAP